MVRDTAGRLDDRLIREQVPAMDRDEVVSLPIRAARNLPFISISRLVGDWIIVPVRSCLQCLSLFMIHFP